MNLARITRLIKLIGLLQGSRGYNAHALAEACDVSRRTIFRDLDTLRLSGVPLMYDAEQRQFHIPGTYFLPPTNFTTEEALAVLVLCHEMGRRHGVPYYAAAQRAAAKLENALPARLRDLLKQIVGSVQIKLRATSLVQNDATVYQRLVEAVGHRRSVRIQYDSFAEQEAISTKLSPYRILFSGHSWYCVGRSSLHRAVRTFNIGRVQSLEPLDDTFKVPAGFSLDRYLRNAWHLIPEPGKDHDVVIRFSKMVARNVAEVAWHKTQHTEMQEDGSMLFSATVSGLNEICWWVLGYGDQAEVLQPKPLRAMVARRVKETLTKYEK